MSLYFASALNTSRLYEISLIFLSPFCVVGGLTIFKIITKILKVNWKNKTFFNIFSIFLVIFLFFNVGFVFQVTNDVPTSIALSNNFYYPIFNENQEIQGANWLYDSTNRENIYADNYMTLLFNDFRSYSENIPPDLKFPKNSYIYLGSYDMATGNILTSDSNNQPIYIGNINVTQNKNEIFDNGGFQISSHQLILIIE